MANIQQKYSDSRPIAIALAGLVDTGWRQSAAVDNSSDLFCDALVGGRIKTGAGAGAGDYVDLYVSASADNGSTYGGDCSGSEGPYAGKAGNLVHLARILTDAPATSFEFGPLSIAPAFGTVLPKHWTLVVDNESDSTLDPAPASHELHYMGVSLQTN